MKNISLKNFFIIIYSLICIFLILIGIIVLQIRKMENEMELTAYNRDKLQYYAAEYKNSIYKQSIKIQEYIITQNKKIEKEYAKEIAVRQGESSSQYDKQISLSKTIENYGISDEELACLSQVDSILNLMQYIEQQGINAMSGRFIDETGLFSIKMESDTILAKNLIFSDNYRNLLQKSTSIIDSFSQLVDKRLGNEEIVFTKKIKANLLYLFFLIIVSIFLLYLSYKGIKVKVIDRIFKLNKHFSVFSLGDFSQTLNIQHNDEIGQLVETVNKTSTGLKIKSDFVEEVGRGNYSTIFEPLSEQDIIGISLLKMRKNLIHNKEEEEKRKLEDMHRNWFSQGNSKFSDILRQESGNMKMLGERLISELVKYTNSNQGGIFLLNDQYTSEHYLELLACYAYDRLRVKSKKILLGEGLVGNCALEKKTIYLTDIPKDYIKITSGLGGIVPTSVLIVPLMHEEMLVGVIELASFNTYQAHELEFIERISENTASTLSIAKINERTTRLLRESQEQTEQMSEQEEEMRQNLEELEATQEELSRKQKEQEDTIVRLNHINETKIKEIKDKEIAMEGILNALNTTTFLMEYDLDGRITYINNYAANLLDIDTITILGRFYDEMEYLSKDQRKQLQQMWPLLIGGETIKLEFELQINGQPLFLAQNYIPIVDESGVPYKVLTVAFDITKEKQKELEMKKLFERIAHQNDSSQRTIDKILRTSDRKLYKLRTLISQKEIEIEILNMKLEMND